MDIAVAGNSPVNAGFAAAADLALGGHNVRLAAWPGAEASLAPIERRGGFEVRGDAAHLASGRLGLAKLRPTTLDEAVKGAEIVFFDAPPADYETRFALLIPHLRSGQIVHVNSHGYWPAMRLWPLLVGAGVRGVTITEGSAPTNAAAYDDGVVTAQCLRRKLPVAAFPAQERGDALGRLRRLFPAIEPADSVLQTGFAGLNMLVHAGMAILNIGWFDRALAAGETASFYGRANTRHTGKLAEAQDAERRPVCEAYGAPWRSLAQYLKDYYGARGETIEELVQGCDYYQSLAPQAADTWTRWLAADVPYAHTPFAALAELAGVPVPIHRAFIAIAGAVMGRDFWAEGVTLERLGVTGMTAADVRRYVVDGRRP